MHDGPVIIWRPKRVHAAWLSKIALLAWQEKLQKKANIHYFSMRWMLKNSGLLLKTINLNISFRSLKEGVAYFLGLLPLSLI